MVLDHITLFSYFFLKSLFHVFFKWLLPAICSAYGLVYSKQSYAVDMQFNNLLTEKSKDRPHIYKIILFFFTKYSELISL